MDLGCLAGVGRIAPSHTCFPSESSSSHVLAHLFVPLAPRAHQASVEDIDSGSVQVNLQRRNNCTRPHIGNEPPQHE